LISVDAINFLSELLRSYPNCKENKIVSFNGNMIKGNLLFNRIVDLLLEDKKIYFRILRINCLDLYDDLFLTQNVDIVFVDNVDSEYLTKQSIESLLRIQEHFYPICNLIIYNVPKISNDLPKIFRDLLDLSTNIKF
jgi:hypothetical protein